MEFSERLKIIRLQKGLSQAQLAESVGVSMRTISCWEHGSKNPTLTYLVSLTKALEVSADDLLNSDETSNGFVNHLLSNAEYRLVMSITEANQNFSKVARLVDERGTAVILKNNVPRYLVIDFSKAEENAIASDEDVSAISKRLLAQNKEAYEVLAK